MKNTRERPVPFYYHNSYYLSEWSKVILEKILFVYLTPKDSLKQ